MRQNFCTYCGGFRESRDHVIPVSMQRVYRNYIPRECVPCCLECNRRAGDYPARNILDKARMLLGRYQKSDREDRTAFWTKKEIAELDYSLRMFVTSRTFRKTELKKKIENLKRVALGIHPIPIYEKIKTTSQSDLCELWERLLETQGLGKVLQREVPELSPLPKQKRKYRKKNPKQVRQVWRPSSQPFRGRNQLTKEEIEAIRENKDWETLRRLAERYRVSQKTVFDIRFT